MLWIKKVKIASRFIIDGLNRWFVVKTKEKILTDELKLLKNYHLCLASVHHVRLDGLKYFK